MAKVRSIAPSSQRVKAHPTAVDCQFAVIRDGRGEPLIHLSTFGSDNRMSAPKSSQSFQLDRPMAEQLVELLIDTFGFSPADPPEPAGASNAAPESVRRVDVALPAIAEQGVEAHIAAVITSRDFMARYEKFSPRFSPMSIGILLSAAIASNGRLPFDTVAQLLGIRASRVRQAVAVLSQVINGDGATLLEENGVEVVLHESLMFEEFGIRTR
ncbi:hypothetical protein [Rhodococcus sp. NBC_00294]|uniref:hypothetical protein n=1 Tax=Rhodococcus sp. NBC_00294 TaxID=2976004 RepID=UPI002E2D7200|nr:hypothetical protein [Rhodococcus sp. NBC_00294]